MKLPCDIGAPYKSPEYDGRHPTYSASIGQLAQLRHEGGIGTPIEAILKALTTPIARADPDAGSGVLPAASLPPEVDPALARRVAAIYRSYEQQILALKSEVAKLRENLDSESQKHVQVLHSLRRLHTQLLAGGGADGSPGADDAGIEEIIDAVTRLAKESEQVKGMLKTSVAWFRALTENALDLTAILDGNLAFTFVTPSVTKLLGIDGDDLLGEPFLDLVQADDRSLVQDWLGGLIAGLPVATPLTFRARHRDDGYRVLEVSGNNCLDLAAVNGIVVNGRDITERALAEERIRHLAHHDELTGLPNRNLVSARTSAAVSRAEREGTRVALMFMDLDRFKHVNDSLGHQLGDRLLQHTAQLLLGALREVDVVGRLGGDEFVLVFTDIRELREVEQVAGRVLELVSTSVSLEGHELQASASLGISIYPDDAHNLDTLMRNADTAMYHAKAAGRNTFRFFTEEMNRAAQARLSLETRLRRAVRNQEFQLYYQPIVRSADAGVVGAEALIRWNDPEHGMVSPADFIPVAEDLGVIDEIGAWVLQEACRQARAWQDALGVMIPVAVNLSAEQFRTRKIIDTVNGALRASGLDPCWLQLEITESLLMEHTGQTTAILSELNAMGVLLSIDDFGTGYSSLSYLTRFPIHKLKIDRSFVRDLEADRSDAAVTSAVIALGKSLNLIVLAEGVETQGQKEFLQARGCDELQGFLFSKPLPAAEFGRLVTAWQPETPAPQEPFPFRAAYI